MADGLVKGSGVGEREWREDFQLINDSGTTVFKVAKTDGAVTMTGAQGLSGNITVTNTAPSLTLADSTSSAKDLKIAVDADKAQLMEAAGSAGSLLVLDLANNRVGVATAAPSVALEVTGAITCSGNFTSTGIGYFGSTGQGLFSYDTGYTVLGGTAGSGLRLYANGASVMDIAAGGVFTLTGASSQFVMPELAGAPTGIANKAIIYAIDNGAGKTQLMCMFPTGAGVQLAIEA